MATDDTAPPEDDEPGLRERLREALGTGSLTGGSVTGGTGGTGGLGTGAGDMSGGSRRGGDVMTGGDDGVDTTGSGGPTPAPPEPTDRDPG